MAAMWGIGASGQVRSPVHGQPARIEDRVCEEAATLCALEGAEGEGEIETGEATRSPVVALQCNHIVHPHHPLQLAVLQPTSRVRLNVGGKLFETTVETLTQRDSDSMLAAMFSGRHTLQLDSDKGSVFIDRDGKHFRHILNWLRDGSVPFPPNPALYHELLREAEYFQLRGLVAQLTHETQLQEDDNVPELSRKEVLLLLHNKPVRLRGVNLCGENLSKLDLSGVDFSCARLVGTFFSRANLQNSIFRESDADRCNLHGAILKECDFEKASLRGSVLSGANLNSANLQEACLVGASLCGADLRSAHLQGVDLSNANLSRANLEQANLKGAKLSGASLQGANLQRAYLRDVDLSNTNLEGANLFGANLMGATRGT